MIHFIIITHLNYYFIIDFVFEVGILLMINLINEAYTRIPCTGCKRYLIFKVLIK